MPKGKGRLAELYRQTVREFVDGLVARFGWRAPWLEEREQLRKTKVPASFQDRSRWPDNDLSGALREQTKRGGVSALGRIMERLRAWFRRAGELLAELIAEID